MNDILPMIYLQTQDKCVENIQYLEAECLKRMLELQNSLKLRKLRLI